MRINVGCGRNPLPGWRNFDNSPSVLLAKLPLVADLLGALRLIDDPQRDFIQFARANRIERGDALKGLPVPQGSVEVLYSSHVLEHLDRVEAILFLKEARRMLRPGGILRLSVPDLRRKVQRYLKDGDADMFIADTGLIQPRPRSLVQGLRNLILGTRHHQWMYDESSLCRLLTVNGFENATAVLPGQTRIPDPGPLDLFERAATSIYVEAENPGDT